MYNNKENIVFTDGICVKGNDNLMHGYYIYTFGIWANIFL